MMAMRFRPPLPPPLPRGCFQDAESYWAHLRDVEEAKAQRAEDDRVETGILIVTCAIYALAVVALAVLAAWFLGGIDGLGWLFGSIGLICLFYVFVMAKMT